MGTKRATPGGARGPTRTRARLGAVVLTLATLATAATAACGGGGGDEAGGATTTGAEGAASATTASHGGDGTTTPPATACAGDRRGVVVDIGTLTFGAGELARWSNDPTYQMRVRPGAPELLQAYRERDYEILYITGVPSDSARGLQPFADAFHSWLQQNGFPDGDGTQYHAWDRAAHPSAGVFKTQTLVDADLDGLSVDYGYTDDANDVRIFLTGGGIPADHVFTVGGFEGGPVTSGVPETDWTSHRIRVVDPLPPLCPP
jgi:hypothetical protein